MDFFGWVSHGGEGGICRYVYVYIYIYIYIEYIYIQVYLSM